MIGIGGGIGSGIGSMGIGGGRGAAIIGIPIPIAIPIPFFPPACAKATAQSSTHVTCKFSNDSINIRVQFKLISGNLIDVTNINFIMEFPESTNGSVGAGSELVDGRRSAGPL